MANNSAKKTTKRPSTPKKRTASRKGKSAAAAQKAPVRRLVAAIVFLAFAVFTFLGYFTSDGVFVNWFCGLIRGLIGNGFGFVPPLLLVCALTLFFHHGRPVLARTLCAFFLPSVCGALWQLFGGNDYELGFNILKPLWLDGRDRIGGGAFAGCFPERARRSSSSCSSRRC